MFRTCTHPEVSASLETIGAAFAIFAAQGNKPPASAELVSANTLFEDITGQPLINCIGRRLEDFLPEHVEKQIRGTLTDSIKQQHPQETELLIEREGISRWWRFLVSPVISDHTLNQRMIVTLIEITEKKILEQKLAIIRERYAAVVETAYDGIITIDQNQNIKMLNSSAREILGLGDEQGVGDHLSRFIPPQFKESHWQHIKAFQKSPVNVRPMQARPPVRALREDGSEVDIEVSISKITVCNEIEMTAVIRDISERTRFIEQLEKAATHDSLTGIFNRRHGAAILNNEIQRCRRFKHPLSVSMIDLDHFKEINDSYGHAYGDLVLNSVVATLKKTLRDPDTLCRWGGEEFLIVLPETTLDNALLWAERARKSIESETIRLTETTALSITASFGLASLSSHDTTADNLLKRADDALYRAKNSGRNQVFKATAEPGTEAAGDSGNCTKRLP
jgi:diguanylate cyclase (GGDEF)-like protein/PAS domain S-box-containing protein